MTLVAINDFISLRGLSGSSRGSELVAAALSLSDDVITLAPDEEPQLRQARFVNMLWWDFVAAPRKAARHGAQCIIHTTNTGGGRRGLPAILLLHDTMVLDHPRLFDSGYRRYAQVTFGRSVRSATVVVTPSQHSAARISERWPLAGVRVIPWPSTRMLGDTRPPERDPLSRDLLVVAPSNRHKRIELAVDAVARLRAVSGEPWGLTIVGGPGNGEADLERAVVAHDPRRSWIRREARVSDEELRSLYEQSFALIVSSIDEGYCLPAIEATTAGTPVVHCNRGALGEVVPRSGFFAADTTDEESLVDQMMAVRDPETRRRWVRDAQEHSGRASFSTFASQWQALTREFAR